MQCLIECCIHSYLLIDDLVCSSPLGLLRIEMTMFPELLKLLSFLIYSLGITTQIRVYGAIVYHKVHVNNVGCA
jgi:hypothetical protein